MEEDSWRKERGCVSERNRRGRDKGKETKQEGRRKGREREGSKKLRGVVIAS